MGLLSCRVRVRLHLDGSRGRDQRSVLDSPSRGRLLYVLRYGPRWRCVTEPLGGLSRRHWWTGLNKATPDRAGPSEVRERRERQGYRPGLAETRNKQHHRNDQSDAATDSYPRASTIQQTSAVGLRAVHHHACSSHTFQNEPCLRLTKPCVWLSCWVGGWTFIASIASLDATWSYVSGLWTESSTFQPLQVFRCFM